jgi:hypothetical protein
VGPPVVAGAGPVGDPPAAGEAGPDRVAAVGLAFHPVGEQGAPVVGERVAEDDPPVVGGDRPGCGGVGRVARGRPVQLGLVVVEAADRVAESAQTGVQPVGAAEFAQQQ